MPGKIMVMENSKQLCSDSLTPLLF